MQSTSMPFSPIKDGRRILGEKDANACLSPAHQSKQSVSVTGTPVKRTLFTNASPKKLLPSPVFAGQKRSRDQVDETNVNIGHVQEPRGLEDQSSQSTIGHDAQQLNQESDAMGCVPTPSSQPERAQPQDQMETDRPSTASNNSKKETRSIPQDPDARKAFIQQKATLLRNTLRNAMRNVTDPQIDRRVFELEEHSRKQPRLSFPVHSSSPSLPYQGTAPHSQTRTPRIGSAADMSSTPSQPTPDLPAQPSSMINGSARAKTSARTPPRTLGSPMQLSSPPATVRHSHNQSHDIAERAPCDVEESARGALSPSQRGDAVDGLLKLMNTADRHDALNT